MFIGYLAFFVTPFVVQVFSENHRIVQACDLLCISTAFLLFVFEIVQMKHKQLKYFAEAWNIVDLLHFFNFITYFIMR